MMCQLMFEALNMNEMLLSSTRSREFIVGRKLTPVLIYQMGFLLRVYSIINLRDIEWSLRAFASMRAMCLFFRARAVVNFLLRAASTLE